tara:strand:- start:10721 stop:11431 length:711 start_codon:yes stop_codon:yes gene_type:complete
MKKNYIILFLFFLVNSTFSQDGVKIGYIDTEYILENLAEYSQVSKRLDEKTKDWKKEIEDRSRVIEQKKASLDSERILLTKDMIEEIEAEISYEEEELIDYQQKRFGPRGDFIIQRKQLTQPIQDQILTAITEIAKSENYDFIFDKSADIVMLYSHRRHNISDQVLYSITTSNNREKFNSTTEKKETSAESLINDKIAQNELNKKEPLKDSKKVLTIKEILELRKQKETNDIKVKD